MRLTRHAEVRHAAKDWRTSSSDLQGDADVRDYRQLPFEVDPPAHRRYRDLLEPFFGRRSVAEMTPAIQMACAEEVHRFVTAGGGDALHDLAFPVVLRSLAVAFRRTADIELDGPCDLVFERVGAAEVPVVMRRVPVRVSAGARPSPPRIPST